MCLCRFIINNTTNIKGVWRVRITPNDRSV